MISSHLAFFFPAGTCIYEAMAAWIDMLARMEGRICKISAMDLQMKEECLMSEETDRTKRCIDVLENIGLCSEADFESNVSVCFLSLMVLVTLIDN